MDWMTLPLKRYAEFSGRARPKEYWMYALFLFLCMAVLNIIEGMVGLGAPPEWAYRNGWNMGAGAHHEGGPLIGLLHWALSSPRSRWRCVGCMTQIVQAGGCCSLSCRSLAGSGCSF